MLKRSMELYNRMIAQFLASCTPVILSEHQGHSNWNQTAEFTSV